MINENYPSPQDLSEWCDQLVGRADTLDFDVEHLDYDDYRFELGVRHTQGNEFLAFKSKNFDTFYAYWQPMAGGGPGPILVHIPGYGAELSAHPQLVAEGFNVLHVNPLGYGTPTGPDQAKQDENNSWPVIGQTIESFGEKGYCDWLVDALVAVRWALEQKCVQPSRLGFFGSSQGGGGALLLASILGSEAVKAVAADVPYLTNFPMMKNWPQAGTFIKVQEALDKVAKKNPDKLKDAWRALGFIDTISHAHRLNMPVMLTAGELDTAIPPDWVESLFEVLPHTKSYTKLAAQGHAYTMPFLRLAKAWFGMYI